MPCLSILHAQAYPTVFVRTVPTDLEWKLTYVGSAESEKYDQVLDSVFVGPVAPGQYRFVFQVRGGAGSACNETLSRCAWSAAWRMMACGECSYALVMS